MLGLIKCKSLCLLERRFMSGFGILKKVNCVQAVSVYIVTVFRL